jgi:DNA-binding SARP family transcriptional activator
VGHRRAVPSREPVLMNDLLEVVDDDRSARAKLCARWAACGDQRATLDAPLDPVGLRFNRLLEHGRSPSTRRGEEAEGRDVHFGADVHGHVHVRLLDGFGVLVNGTPKPIGRWTKRYAAALVKLLALSPRGRLHRERVVDALWPDATLDVALPRLHKAAHYARRDLGDRHAVVLRDQVVALFPLASLEVDAVKFEAAADVALSTKPVSTAACASALKLAGDLLPEDLAEWWLDEPRDRLRLRVGQLLRGARRWEDLLRLDPANERAHVELLREAVMSGDRTNALRRFALMERSLRAELGISPGREAIALRERLVAS